MAEIAVDGAVYLGDSYLKGRRETVDYTNAKLVSGNQSSLTNDRLQEIAIKIKGPEGTQKRAAEVLSELLKTGKVRDDVITDVGTATAEANRVRRVPISDTVGIFEKLHDEPTKTSIELNRSQSYLNAETLRQIIRLEKAGQLEEAGSLAQKAYADALNKRTQQYAKNQIFPDHLVQFATDKVDRIDDAARNFGREKTKQQRIDEANADYKRHLLRDTSESGNFGETGGGAATGVGRPNLAMRRKKLDALMQEQREEIKQAEEQAASAASTRAEVAAVIAQEEEGRGNAKTSGSIVEKKVAKRTQVSRSTEPGVAVSRKALDSQSAASGIQRAESEGLRPCIEIVCGCKAGMSDQTKRREGKDQAGEATESVSVDSKKDHQAELLEAMKKSTSSVVEQTTALEAQNAAHGKTKSVVKELNIAQLERQYQDLDNTERVVPGYLDALGARIDAEKALLKVTRDAEGIEASDKEKKKKDDKATKLADDIGGAFREGFVGLLEGKDNVLDKLGESLKKKITASVADALYEATLKPAVDAFSSWLPGAFKGIFNTGGSGGSSGGGGASSGGSWIGSAVSTVLGFFGVKSANGNVFSSPGLHAYANRVVGQPTFFPFANGIGLMGEAGPEAIMPLRRGSDGRLGVSAPGGADGSPTIQFAPSNVFHIDARSDRGAVMADMQRLLAENNRGQMEQLKRVKVLPQ